MTKGKPDARGKRTEQTGEAQFLVEEFGVKVPDAAALVSEDGENADELAEDVHKAEKSRDLLEGVPVPKGDPKTVRKDSDETALKPVLNRRNDSGS